MATQILSKKFTDIFGNETTFYRANAGDKITSTFEVRNLIEAGSSDTNYFYVYPSINTITRMYGNWEDDGLREGQTVQVRNPAITTFTTTITAIYGNTIELATLGALAGVSSEGESFGTIDFVRLNSNTQHDCVDALVNFVNNGGSTSTNSLIDGENTVIRFAGLNALTVGGSITGVQVGHKSGQFNVSGEITLDSEDVDNFTRVYTFEIVSYQPGPYLESNFIGADCLKQVVQFNFQVVEGEPYANTIVSFNSDADTGAFDQAFNTGIVDATLVDSINEINYGATGEYYFKVDSLATERYFSSLYIPLDDNYFKNNNSSQSKHTMIMQSHFPFAPGPYFSVENDLGAGYVIEMNLVGTVGTVSEYHVIFAPNSDFIDFMDSREDGDRRFVLYFRCGNINLTVFDGQLIKEPPVAGVLPDVTDTGLNFHNENTSDFVSSETFPVDTYTEDDLGYVLLFRPEKEDVYSLLRVDIEVFNTVSGDSFNLESIVFDFNNVQISNDGVYLFNESIGVTNNLPPNSAKKQATLERYSSIDTGTKYGVKLYYPFINRWEYWLSQTNADVAFYPNQNKNWFEYDNTLGWNIRIRTSLETDEQAFIHEDEIAIKDYDSGSFTSEIQLFRENGDPCNAIVDGEIMTVKAIHTALAPINPETAWGWIGVEPFEGQPRFICSTVIGNGNDTNNPLFNIILETSGNNLIFTCNFDTNKIDLSNGVSITSRAFGTDEFDDYWLTTDGDSWYQEGSTDKWIIE